MALPLLAQPLRAAHSTARPRRRTLPLIAAAPLAFGLPAWADDAEKAESPPAQATLNEVRVEAQAEAGAGFAPAASQSAGKASMRLLETPQSVSVVTREQMESRQITVCSRPCRRWPA